MMIAIYNENCALAGARAHQEEERARRREVTP